MEEVFVGLGSNMGDKGDFLREAVLAITKLPQTQGLQCSSIWETLPWGTKGQEVYYNAVVRFFTRQSPNQLLNSLQQIEQCLGRTRPYHWAPRTIDLDLLLYGNYMIQSEKLTVPHPRMKQRLFVLVPLAEVCSDLHFPDGDSLQMILQKRIRQETLTGISRTKEKWNLC